MNSISETPAPVPFHAPGMVKPRDLKIARQLARCCTGLGHIYAGELVRGLRFAVAMELPLCLGALALVAPWGSLWMAMALWSVSVGVIIWAGRDLRKVLLRTRQDYRMKDYNHWAAYLLIGVFPTVAPAFAVAIAISTTLSRPYRAAVDMPSLDVAKGDLLVAWKSAYRKESPKKGDRIAFLSSPSSSTTMLGRVTGLPGETVATTSGETVLPPACVSIERDDQPGTNRIVSEFAVTARLVYRVWPPTRIGSLADNGSGQ